MKYCSGCGERVEQRIPEGDNRHRYVCTHCDIIHYQNPLIIAGTVAVWNNRILLCRRAIEPRYGYWTLPAGFMENQETTEEAAARETREEALAEVDMNGLYAIINVPHINQIHMFYRATLINGAFGAGQESLESQLFEPSDIPWRDLSFPTVRKTLELFIKDMKQQSFGVHVDSIRHPMAQTGKV